MQAGWRRLINQFVIGQLWPPRPQSVEHILLLLGLLTRTKWRGLKRGMGEKQKGKEKKSKAGKNEGHLKWRERVKEGKWDEREHTKKNKAGKRGKKKNLFFFFFFSFLMGELLFLSSALWSEFDPWQLRLCKAEISQSQNILTFHLVVIS